MMRSSISMNLDDFRDLYGDDLLFMDGFDDCIAGVVTRFGQEPIICYDREKVITKLATDMSREEAEEFFSFNQIGAWMGERTPCFISS